MHEAKTVGIFRSVRFFGKNTIGQFFREVSEICDGCAILSNVRIVKQRIVLRLLYCLLPLLVRRLPTLFSSQRSQGAVAG